MSTTQAGKPRDVEGTRQEKMQQAHSTNTYPELLVVKITPSSPTEMMLTPS